uniref:Uncharacterized protein n=1 Tax=Daphnia magna TaxID=35525 RepID=A0A0P6D4S7_9CRUS
MPLDSSSDLDRVLLIWNSFTCTVCKMRSFCFRDAGKMTSSPFLYHLTSSVIGPAIRPSSLMK